MSTRWMFFPKSDPAPAVANEIISVFEAQASNISSEDTNLVRMPSNDALAILRPDLKRIGFDVESGKKKSQLIHVPVLYGLNGAVDKSFSADAYHRDAQFVLEVEGGRGVAGYQFLKDLFQACVMVDVNYLGIAVKNRRINTIQKTGKDVPHDDFKAVVNFIDTIYTSGRMELPLKGVLVIGY